MAPKPKNIIRSLKSAADAPPVAGFLEYKPGPGIYSRLERAVQQLPENVRVQELPGLLKRYKDGIPGWELKAVDFDSVVGDRTTVPRDELLAAVRERSPVFTHGEVMLGGDEDYWRKQRDPRVFIDREKWIGGSQSPGAAARYEEYGQGGKDYRELLLTQESSEIDNPLRDTDYANHWKVREDPAAGDSPENTAVAHIRYDTHGDALRINELQSDLGIHNRAAREPHAQHAELPFPLEDAWADLLTKRAVLEAARQGHRAIEVASPRSIADKFGGNIDNYEHFYGKVVPGSLERLGRKMGGLAEDTGSPAEATINTPSALRSAAVDAATSANAFLWRTRRKAPGMSRQDYMEDEYHEIVRKMALMRKAGHSEDSIDRILAGNYQAAYEAGVRSLTEGNMQLGPARKQAGLAMGELIARAKAQSALEASLPAFNPNGPAGRRYVMSDEMRKNIITKGIPAAIAIGTAAGATVGSSKPAEAGPLQAASDAAARAAMPANTVNSIRRLKQQAEAAYLKAEQTQNPADFKRAENLDAKLEEQYEKWDSRLEDLDEGDGDVDMEEDDPQGSVDEDMEPDESRPSPSVTEQVRDAYQRYLNGEMDGDSDYVGGRLGPPPSGQPPIQVFTGGQWVDVTPEQSLARRVRSAVAGEGFMATGDDLNFARGEYDPAGERAARDAVYAAPDEQINEMARDLYQSHENTKAKLRNATPEDNVRAMQARLRDLPAGALPVPIMAQAQSVNENRELPTGSGGNWNDIRKNMVGDFDFSMAISPEEWDDYYRQGETPEHQKFKANVAEVMNQPIIRVGAANDSRLMVEGDQMDRITPAQFVKEYLDVYGQNLDENARAQVASSVMARLDGSSREPNFMADDIVDRMMGSLRESSPQGKYAKMDPMPQEQLDAMRQQYGDWADSMLTPGTSENFEALRGYELLRTTLDGQHAPVYADNLSNAAAFVGGFVDPKSRQNFGDATFESGPEGRFRRANRDYFGSRIRPDEPAAFRDPDGTSRFASTSATNIQGMLRAGGDTSNPIGAVSWPLYEAFSEFSRTPVGKAVTGEGLPALWEGGDDWNFMAQKRQAFDREQPIQPAGMTREEFDRQLADHRRDREQGEAWGATTFPNVQNVFDTVTGSKTQRTWGPPVYNDYVTNFLPNTVGNIPSAAIMAGSAATGGVLGGLAGAAMPKAGLAKAATAAASGVARGAARGAGATVTSQVKDAPFDFATDQAIGGALGGGLQNYLDYITTAEQNNALLPDVKPDEISLEELNRKRAAAMETREDRFKRNQFDWNRR